MNLSEVVKRYADGCQELVDRTLIIQDRLVIKGEDAAALNALVVAQSFLAQRFNVEQSYAQWLLDREEHEHPKHDARNDALSMLDALEDDDDDDFVAE